MAGTEPVLVVIYGWWAQVPLTMKNYPSSAGPELFALASTSAPDVDSLIAM